MWLLIFHFCLPTFAIPFINWLYTIQTLNKRTFAENNSSKVANQDIDTEVCLTSFLFTINKFYIFLQGLY